MDERTRTLLDELASVFDSETEAMSLLDRAGIPRGRLLPFGQMTPIAFWESVYRQLDKGLTQDGLPGLVEAAAGLYPHNEIFRRETTVQTSEPVSPAADVSTPTAPPEEETTVKTLLLCDVVGSTKLTTELGDERTATIWKLHDHMARELLSRFKGREIDKTDGFLLLFYLPLPAVRYAMAYHDGLAEISAAEGVKLTARVGIHVGQVIVRPNPLEHVVAGAKPFEVEGLAKPEAARIMSLAGGRQTLLSRTAFEFAKKAAVGHREETRLHWLSHGKYLLKGVDEPVEIYETGVEGIAPLTPPEDTEKARRVAEGSVQWVGAGPSDTDPMERREWGITRERPPEDAPQPHFADETTRGQSPPHSTVAELRAWLGAQEPDHNLLKRESRQQFLASLRSNPGIYTALAEEIACEDPPNPWAEQLLQQGFVDHYETPAVSEELRRAFDRWFGFVHPAGTAMRGTSKDSEIEEHRKRLQERLGQTLEPGELEFAGYRLTVVEQPGLLRLGQLALAVMSRFSRRSWVSTIAKGCVAEAVMDCAKKYQLFAWVVRSAPEPNWEELETEVRRLVEYGHVVTKQAAYRLLSFQGSEQAAKLKEEAKLDAAELFPTPPELSRYDDPCYRPWRFEDCETCLERTDFHTMVLARQLEPWYPEPKLTVSRVFIDRLSEEIDKISPEEVWKSLWRDLEMETLEGALCAAAPEIYARLVRLVAATQERQGEALWRWTVELRAHSLLLREEEQQIVYRTWKRLSQEKELDSQEGLAEQFLFTLIFPQLNASDQFAHILQRSEDSTLDLISYEAHFQPLTGAAEIESLLDDADATPIRAARVLWFLSVHARALPRKVVEKASRFLSHDSSLVRFNALRLLHNSNHLSAFDAIEKTDWRSRPENNPIENHWGSLLVASRGHHLSFSKLSARLDPGYLGYAVQKRGFVKEEILKYGEALHRDWKRIANQASQPLEEMPRVEIEAPVDPAEPLYCRPKLVSRTELQMIGWFNPHAYWGRVPDEMDSGSQRSPWQWPSEEQEQERRRIYQEEYERQHELGNVWFARVFYTNALPEVVRLRRDDLVREWLSAGRDQLKLASTFYEGLCGVLLRESPEDGIDLYRRLKKEQLPVKITAHGIERLDFFLFKAPATPVVQREWEERLDKCCTDKELLELVVAAEHGNGNRWLWKICQQHLASATIWKQARALILLGLSSASPAQEILKQHAERGPACWLTEVGRKAEQYRRHNEWARHWYSDFINAKDDIEAWAAFRLLLRCVDRRFWLWWPRFEELSPELPGLRRRRAFFENNHDTLRNHIQANEKPLEKTFVGAKVLAGEVEPWLEEFLNQSEARESADTI